MGVTVISASTKSPGYKGREGTDTEMSAEGDAERRNIGDNLSYTADTSIREIAALDQLPRMAAIASSADTMSAWRFRMRVMRKSWTSGSLSAQQSSTMYNL